MKISTFGATALLATLILGYATTANAICSPAWADVTSTCPQPVPYPGPKYLTPTSRNMPTVGTPGLYKNWGNGYDVRVYMSQNGTGQQQFQWAVPTDYGKRNY